jgi:hypothetical protein
MRVVHKYEIRGGDKLRACGRGLVAGTALTLVLALAGSAWPGGSGDEDEQQHQDAPSYFGFVKDTSGKIIADAKVKADIKGRAALVARTNAVGMYKIPGLVKDIGPNDVTISCSKEGYRQIRIFRRSPQNAKPPIQVECTMQSLSGK